MTPMTPKTFRDVARSRRKALHRRILSFGVAALCVAVIPFAAIYARVTQHPQAAIVSAQPVKGNTVNAPLVTSASGAIVAPATHASAQSSAVAIPTANPVSTHSS
jgi:uncharacterized membrane protein YjfL (UPF0719 family)